MLHYPLCCCNNVNFPVVGQIKVYLILFLFHMQMHNPIVLDILHIAEQNIATSVLSHIVQHYSQKDIFSFIFTKKSI